MEEKKLLREQLLKNALSTFIAFTILVLIFDFVIYKRAEQVLYKEIDDELKEINDLDSQIIINPRIIYILRDKDGNVLNENSLGRVYDDYLDSVEFDDTNINTIYTIKVNGKYNYRGITTTGYNIKTNEKIYLQLLTNVDGEIVTLRNLKARLFGTSLIILVSSMVISYLLAKSTLKSIIENYKKQTEFVQNAAHELRTPLTIIQAKQQLLLQEPESKIIDKSEDINLTINETRRLGKLVKELMLLATADSNNLKLTKEPVNIDKLIKEVTVPYVEYASLQKKTLTMELNSNKVVNLDASKISQLIVILLDNAIKYTAEGEKIKISTLASKENRCTIIVSDTGIGIGEEQKKHIFERFYRADKARSRETGGTGLGLAIAQTIVKLHGGSIKVSNNEPKGTKFTIKI